MTRRRKCWQRKKAACSAKTKPYIGQIDRDKGIRKLLQLQAQKEYWTMTNNGFYFVVSSEIKTFPLIQKQDIYREIKQ